ELFDRPANIFVAGFIGSPAMNMLKGTIADDGQAVVVNGARLPIPATRTAPPGQPVIFGVRPEHLDLSPEGFTAHVSVVEPTGSETMVFLRFGKDEIVALFRERHDFKPGDRINLLPRAAQVH